MKEASPKVIPNVFVKSACLGNAWAAKGAWVKRRPELNGFAPYEIWDHPELLLSEQEREENPTAGQFTLVTVRGKVVRAIAFLYSHESTLVVAHSVGNLPVGKHLPSVRDEDPAPVPAPIRMAGKAFEVPGTFRRLPIRLGMVDDIRRESGIIASRQRKKNRHRGRPRSSAFRRS